MSKNGKKNVRRCNGSTTNCSSGSAINSRSLFSRTRGPADRSLIGICTPESNLLYPEDHAPPARATQPRRFRPYHDFDSAGGDERHGVAALVLGDDAGARHDEARPQQPGQDGQQSEMREQMNRSWNDARQRRCERMLSLVFGINRLIPRMVRQAPTLWLMRDFRKRLRQNKATV